MMDKTCRICREDKPRGDYNLHDHKTGKLRSECKICQSINSKKHWKTLDKTIEKKRRRAWYKKNIVSVHDKHLRKNFGISRSDYEAMLEIQDGKCAVCGSSTPGRHDHKNFSVDHCHTSGKIRGLLCSTCNTGLGHLQDDVNILQKGIDYLNKFS